MDLSWGSCLTSVDGAPSKLAVEPALYKMRPAVSKLLHRLSSTKSVSSVSRGIGRSLFNPQGNEGYVRSATQLVPAQGDLTFGTPFGGKVFYSTYDDDEPYERVSRPPNLEARMRMKAYRRQALAERRNLDIEEEARNIDLDPAKMLKKGDPGTVQAVIRDVMPVGYFLTMPSGREGYLPATDLGTTGGVVLLERLMKVGQELTVRITKSIKIRDIVSIRPEGWVSPVENPFLKYSK